MDCSMFPSLLDPNAGAIFPQGRDYCFDRSDMETTSGTLTEEVETTAPTEASETMQENEPMKEEEEEASFPLTEEVETPAPTDASEPVQEDGPMNEEEEGSLGPVEEEEATDVPTESSEPAQEDAPMQEEQEEAMGGGGDNDEATVEPTTELSLEPQEPLGDEFIESQMSLQQSTCSSANPCGLCEGGTFPKFLLSAGCWCSTLCDHYLTSF